MSICSQYASNTSLELDKYQNQLELIFFILYNEREIPEEYLPPIIEDIPVVVEPVKQGRPASKEKPKKGEVIVPEVVEVKRIELETILIESRMFKKLIEPLEGVRRLFQSGYKEIMEKKKEIERIEKERKEKEKEEAEKMELESKKNKKKIEKKQEELIEEPIEIPEIKIVDPREEITSLKDITGTPCLEFIEVKDFF